MMVPVTTRSPLPQETDGQEYSFVTVNEFEQVCVPGILSRDGLMKCRLVVDDPVRSNAGVGQIQRQFLRHPQTTAKRNRPRTLGRTAGDLPGMLTGLSGVNITEVCAIHVLLCVVLLECH